MRRTILQDSVPPGPTRRAFPTAWIAAVCRARPVLVVIGAALALAAAAAAGYLLHAIVSQPAAVATASAPLLPAREAQSQPKIRDTVVWRDETGAIYRAKIGGGRLDQFLRQRKGALDAARTESRDQAAAQIRAALKPIFADMTARVPGYADWYFSYLTKYELMFHAVLPGLDYLGRALDIFSPPDKGLYQTIAPHVVAYIEKQYAERVVRPREAEARLSAGFDKSYGPLRAHWGRLAEEQRAAMRAFIKEQAGSAERVPPNQASGIELDWDGRRADRPLIHEDFVAERRIRQGLLSVRLKIAPSAKAPTRLDVSKKAPKEEDDSEEAHEATHVMVNLFDKLIGPVVSQMSDLAIGVFAGSAAGGATVGFGMAGAPAFGAMGVATGVAAAVPVGAAIGLAATVATEVLSNRLEEALNRTEFEEGVQQSVDVTENGVETDIIAVLHEHIEAWYADITKPVPAK
jgi:hypothetical protein